MEDPVLHDLVAMGRFFSSLDGIGVRGVKAGKGKAVERSAGPVPARSMAFGPAPLSTESVRLTIAEAGNAFEVRATPSMESAPLPPSRPRPDRNLASGDLALEGIREVIGDCKRCRLCEGRTKIVFGQGSSIADLMFVGEAPGADEDASGLAFVGRAGQLLTDMIEKGMRLQRSDVFIANVIKCRPPGNRPPEPDETATCQGFLEQQIKVVQPRAIVALGATAAKFMARTADPISRIRGRWHSWDGIPVMPTYHPAYLLRNPAAKKTVWEDLKIVMDLLAQP